MSDTVLVLNSGSSSIKFGLFEISAAEPTLLCKGLLDEHETKPRLVVKSPMTRTIIAAAARTAVGASAPKSMTAVTAG